MWPLIQCYLQQKKKRAESVLLLPYSMPLILHLCLLPLLLLICSSTSCLGSHYDECHGQYTCGGIEFTYPFGQNNNGCGDPQFQLHSCDSDDNPLLNISGNEYHILEPSFLGHNGEHKMKLLNDNLWGGKCNLSGNYSQFWWPGSLFHISADTYTNLSLWGQCNKSSEEMTQLRCLRLCGENWYYNISSPDEGARFCKTHLQIPIDKDLLISPEFIMTFQRFGFEITWHVDTKRSQSCKDCWESEGICGYNISDSKAFLCYCGDNTSHPDKCRRKDRHVIIVIGCSFGGVALIATALLFLTFYRKRIKRTPAPPRSCISKVETFLREYASEMPSRYSQSELKKITNNFAEKLGEGGFGAVFKGKLRNGTLVAVKLLDRHRHGENTQFMNEVATIGRVHHFNLVRLLGYCFESFTCALVYEYMLNGSLEKFIFSAKEKGRILRWEQLYSIALGAARGIAYLHQDCDKRIIHFDIKPHNILLDAEFTPKVSDFGLAKLCGKADDHISMTAVRGTPGYVAPEVCNRNMGHVTDKSDVYSFGMLLLEIVGGRRNIDVQVSRSSQLYFPEWAFKMLENEQLGMRLGGGREGEIEGKDEEKARSLTKIGLWCIQYNPSDRPCMSRVVQMLEGNGDDVGNPPLPFNSSAAPENSRLSSTE